MMQTFGKLEGIVFRQSRLATDQPPTSRDRDRLPSKTTFTLQSLEPWHIDAPFWQLCRSGQFPDQRLFAFEQASCGTPASDLMLWAGTPASSICLRTCFFRRQNCSLGVFSRRPIRADQSCDWEKDHAHSEYGPAVPLRQHVCLQDPSGKVSFMYRR